MCGVSTRRDWREPCNAYETPTWSPPSSLTLSVFPTSAFCHARLDARLPSEPHTPPLDRRDFLSLAPAAALTLTVPTLIRRRVVDDALQVGLIGAGDRGFAHLHRLADLPESPGKPRVCGIPGVRVTAICDTFDVHADRAVEGLRQGGGGRVRSYVDYREMLEREDLDAVVIATPDFTHAPIAIDAVRAGCDVYVEKCMSNTPEHAVELQHALEEGQRVLQVGYQLRQDELHAAARELVRRGYVGEVRMVQSFLRRSGAVGAWKSPLAENGGPPRHQVHWEEFLARAAPAVPYDPRRYFEWRAFWDYGTGAAGDLMSHAMNSVEMVLDLGMPDSVTSSGGVYEWDDGRETPDNWSALLEYEDPRTSVNFCCSLSNSYGKQGTLFLGTEGTLELSWFLNVYADQHSTRYAEQIEDGRIVPGKAFLTRRNEGSERALESTPSEAWLVGRGAKETTIEGKLHDTTYLHLAEFFDCVRSRRMTSANFDTSLASTMSALACAQSYREERRVSPSEMLAAAERKVEAGG